MFVKKTESNKSADSRLKKVITMMLLLACIMSSVYADTETLTLRLVMHIPETYEVVTSPTGDLMLETNCLDPAEPEVKLETWQWEYDEEYTVLCIEHV